MRHYLAAAAIIALIAATSCGRDESWHTVQGVIWNTSYTIKYESRQSLDDSIATAFRDVEMSLSPFNPDSRISRINRNETTETDTLIEYIFYKSTLINRLSDGAFDPTLSPLINLWGFGYEKSPDWSLPSDAAIDSALMSVGIADCHISEGRLSKKSSETTFNFSAITKGYACDYICGMLQRNGVDNCMIEIGGEITLRGHNERGRLWRIMLEAPAEHFDSQRTGMLTIELTDCAIASSGNYRNYREDGARRFGHTISPTTGRPIETETLCTSIIAPDCALADALATATMAMNAQEAVRMLEHIDGTEGIIITNDSIYTIGTILGRVSR
ncbi:MAG: FAD:protein FMN transferase [Muribaculaceae bacterium]|nr:FAD:protein FMN transferase [Muribaculaceae bacterium]